jgi:UTP--glucose-1-phosphate uridylyltransferase
MSENWIIFQTKMKNANLSNYIINNFKYNYNQLLKGTTGMIPEINIDIVKNLFNISDISNNNIDKSLLSSVAILKLNGGLGTTMGLNKAKSLLEVKDNKTFIELIIKQIKFLDNIDLILMNSFNTSNDTKNYLNKINFKFIELMQNKIPKIDANTLTPVNYPEFPDMEWCPPGHGDIYSSLLDSGLLDKLIIKGIKYLFVSNSDNLGAILDFNLLSYFAKNEKILMMEVCERMDTDKKGGHLGKRRADGKLILRENAMCPNEDKISFEDINKHKYFNTNNIWINLIQLKKKLISCNNILQLPIIINKKTVNPCDNKSTSVFQLETAMGSAIECFDNSDVIVVPRSRFIPIKTCNDLFILRSDIYKITPLYTIECIVNKIPIIDLDDKYYKFINEFENLVIKVPSLINTISLTVKGPIKFKENIIIIGNVTLINKTNNIITITNKTYDSGCYYVN